ncbi:MAG TPA: succinate dehydrogenase assembly factor 2 [Burkholderiaceae bacterium]|nr:succinate dehydrogenase assembly factor 2 [Burkholderiaceae bacterium]
MSGGGHQADEVRRRRLRWRARRGLLENDLVMARFFERFESDLTDDDVAGLDRLLDLGDGELLELILGRCELDAASATPQMQRVLEMLRSV